MGSKFYQSLVLFVLLLSFRGDFSLQLLSDFNGLKYFVFSVVLSSIMYSCIVKFSLGSSSSFDTVSNSCSLLLAQMIPCVFDFFCFKDFLKCLKKGPC